MLTEHLLFMGTGVRYEHVEWAHRAHTSGMLIEHILFMGIGVRCEHIRCNVLAQREGTGVRHSRGLRS